MKLTNEQLASLDWTAADKAADDIKRVCADIGFVAPEDTARILTHIARVADQLNAIARALCITPPRSP